MERKYRFLRHLKCPSVRLFFALESAAMNKKGRNSATQLTCLTSQKTELRSTFIKFLRELLICQPLNATRERTDFLILQVYCLRRPGDWRNTWDELS